MRRSAPPRRWILAALLGGGGCASGAGAPAWVSPDTGPCAAPAWEWAPAAVELGPVEVGGRATARLALRHDSPAAAVLFARVEAEPPGTLGVDEDSVVVRAGRPGSLGLWFAPQGFGLHAGALLLEGPGGELLARVPLSGALQL